MKTKWRVFAEVSTKCYIDVEAETQDEAIEIGENTDGGEFISEDEDGDWNVYDAVEVKENSFDDLLGSLLPSK